MATVKTFPIAYTSIPSIITQATYNAGWTFNAQYFPWNVTNNGFSSFSGSDYPFHWISIGN